MKIPFSILLPALFAITAIFSGPASAQSGRIITSCRVEQVCTLGQECGPPASVERIDLTLTSDKRWLLLGPDDTSLETTLDFAANLTYWESDGYTYLLQFTPEDGFLLTKTAANFSTVENIAPAFMTGKCAVRLEE